MGSRLSVPLVFAVCGFLALDLRQRDDLMIAGLEIEPIVTLIAWAREFSDKGTGHISDTSV